MTRIAVIGTSHVAALKLAWGDLQLAYPDLEVGYFTLPQKKFGLAELRPDLSFGLPEELRSKPNSSVWSRQCLDLSTFDYVWHVGGWQIPPQYLNPIILSFNIDGLPGTNNRHWMSRAAYQACLEELVTSALPGPEWHNWDTPKLWYSGVPRRNAHQRTRKLFQHLDLRNHKACWDEADALIAQHTAAVGIPSVPQPEDTLDQHGFTLQEYGTDKPAVNGEGIDIAHMNAAFGAKMWEAFLARIQI